MCAYFVIVTVKLTYDFTVEIVDKTDRHIDQSGCLYCVEIKSVTYSLGRANRLMWRARKGKSAALRGHVFT